MCETWIQNIQFIINLEFQGYLDDNLRCAGILVLLFVCLFVCVLVRMLFYYDKKFHVTGSGKRYTNAHIFKIELLAPRGRVSSQL